MKILFFDSRLRGSDAERGFIAPCDDATARLETSPEARFPTPDSRYWQVKPQYKKDNAGFTLIELIVVVIIIGVLSAIAAPSWVAFIDNRRLSIAQDQISRSLQEAQSNARRDKVTWQVSFRENNGVAQWIVLPASTNPSAVTWQNLDAAIRIVDPIVNANDPDGTTLEFDPTNNLWRMQFNYRGEANSPLGKIAIATRDGGRRWSCVKISTLLGAIQSATDENCLN